MKKRYVYDTVSVKIQRPTYQTLSRIARQQHRTLSGQFEQIMQWYRWNSPTTEGDHARK